MKLYLVCNSEDGLQSDELEIFATDSRFDAHYTATGESVGAYPTVGMAFREAYEDVGPESPHDGMGTLPLVTLYTGTLEAAFNAVRDFHIAFGHPAPESPVMQSVRAVKRRGDWMIDEVMELKVANTIAAQADAYLDIIYFAIGGLVELGIEPSIPFDYAHSANMAKLGPDGKPIKRSDGKVIKPAGWEAPDAKIAAHIEGLIQASLPCATGRACSMQSCCPAGSVQCEYCGRVPE